jgi:hypothetical protein
VWVYVHLSIAMPLLVLKAPCSALCIRFGPHKGDYMYHCHNLRHEDNQMIRAFRIVDPVAGLRSATALSDSQLIINTATGIVYDRSAAALTPLHSAVPAVTHFTQQAGWLTARQ